MYYGHSFNSLSRGLMSKDVKKFNLKEIILLVIVLLLFGSLIRSWTNLAERQKIIKEAKIKLAEEQKEQDNLKRELVRSESTGFIEEQAREKLNMSREGELIILLPTPMISPSPTPSPVNTSANWQKWVRLFW